MNWQRSSATDICLRQSKMLLPFYDFFDEQRYFAPAAKQQSPA